MAKRILSIVLCVILLAGTLVGCKSKTVAKDTGGYITMYLTDEIYDFDPANAYYNSNLSDVLSLMYATLFRLTDSGKVENYLVKSYKIYENAENDEYYMELKLKDTCWSVQDALTAEDVVFAWKRLVNSKNNYEAAAFMTSRMPAPSRKATRPSITSALRRSNSRSSGLPLKDLPITIASSGI